MLEANLLVPTIPERSVPLITYLDDIDWPVYSSCPGNTFTSTAYSLCSPTFNSSFYITSLKSKKCKVTRFIEPESEK